MSYYTPLFLVLLLCVTACASKNTAYVPNAADSIAIQLDTQILQRGDITMDGKNATPNSAEKARRLRNSITIMPTVPVDINNLEVSCPLARQMAEEVSRWLVSVGYSVQELRKAKAIYFQKEQGEMVLTRNPALLANHNVQSQAILAGTYVITPDQVRFNIRLIHTPSNEIIAMGTATVPITGDVRPLLVNSSGDYVKVVPTVQTRLQ